MINDLKIVTNIKEEIESLLHIRATNGFYRDINSGKWFRIGNYDFVDNTYTFYLKDVEKVGVNVKQEQNKAKNPNSKHYELWHEMEAIDVIALTLTNEEYKGFLKGNILKYQLRLGKKDNVEKEMEKIKDYQRELNEILGK